MQRWRLAALFALIAAVVAAPAAAAAVAKTTRLSVSSGGVEGNKMSYNAFISTGGRFVAFQSDVNNLVPGDGNGVSDVFVRGPLR